MGSANNLIKFKIVCNLEKWTVFVDEMEKCQNHNIHLFYKQGYVSLVVMTSGNSKWKMIILLFTYLPSLIC